jgi:murein DD-endopeptidase MepM/ murein hydrolase activator NlpD
MAEKLISHALVLPDKNFDAWLNVVKPYMQAFERVAVVRSPAGNDLNRYRNVSAVQAPATWFEDDALGHIRRAYPMVVRVDVIPAETPEELAPILQERIKNKDRYGEKSNTPIHIYDRFTLEWPTDARPARITRPFSSPTDKNPDNHEGIDIFAPPGSQIYAAASGKVALVNTQPTALGYGQYVQIASQLGGMNYLVTYAYLQNIKVTSGQDVKVGDLIAEAREGGNDSIKIVVQNPPHGMTGFPLPSVEDPTPMIYWQGIRLKPTNDGLRVRKLPNTEGEIVATLKSTEWLETLETHGRTLVKVGVKDQWLRVRTADGKEGYAAAWFLEARTKEDIKMPFPGVNVTGMNLDIFHPVGRPDPKSLGALGWVRLKFNVSRNPDNNTYGNTDIGAAYNRYRPVYEAYAKAGRKVLVVLTHQLYGEGAGYHWPSMDSGKWNEFIPKYADFANRTAKLFAGQGIVSVYQVWNEQDTRPEDGRAAVPIPAADYAKMLAQTIQAIRAADPKALVITGGHVRGAGEGVAYADATLRAMPGSLRPDGIAFHPYGLGPASSPYSIHGRLEPAIERFGNLLPDKPVWITEWGVLDRQDLDETAQVAAYAKGFLDTIRSKYADRVAAAIWYAFAKGMDNGYGLVDRNGQALQPLYDQYLKA